MASLREMVTTIRNYHDLDRFKPILASASLEALQAEGLSIEEILDMADRCDDERLAKMCLVAGVELSLEMEVGHKPCGRELASLMAAMAKIAARWDRTDLLEYCLDRGVDATILPGNKIAAYGCQRSFQMLMSRGLDVNANYGYAGDSICAAAASNQLSMVTFLLDNGAKVDGSSLLHNIYGPLACAAMWASVDMIDLLISRGATIEGSLALHQAAEFGQVEVMKALIRAGADVNESPRAVGSGDTYVWPGPPIFAAVRSRKLETIKILLRHGADPMLLGTQNETVVESLYRTGEPWQELEDLLDAVESSYHHGEQEKQLKDFPEIPGGSSPVSEATSEMD